MRKIAMLLVLLTGAIYSAQAQTLGVEAELSLDQEQYMPDEAMNLKVRITNRSGQPLVLGTDKQWITFEIVGEHEYVVPKVGEMQVMNPTTLRSGQVLTREFNPTPCFSFQRPGRYRISALIKLPQWKKEIATKPVFFEVSPGLPLPNLGDLSFGVPSAPGVTNALPEIRHYSLLKVSYLKELKLYFRLSDKNGRTLRVFSLAPMISFSNPEAQLDSSNNLHVLLQNGARTFTYCVLDPDGNLIARQFHEYAQTRPALNINDQGQIFVGGGRRLLTWSDIPAPSVPTAVTAKSP